MSSNKMFSTERDAMNFLKEIPSGYPFTAIVVKEGRKWNLIIHYRSSSI